MNSNANDENGKYIEIEDIPDDISNQRNKELNIRSTLNLKKYENSIYYYLESLNKKSGFSNKIEILFIFIETVQFFSLFYDSFYFPDMPKSISLIFNIFILKDITSTIYILIIIGVLLFFVLFCSLYNGFFGFSSLRKIPDPVIRVYAKNIFIKK
ncbi:hypothetical protein BCR32DRAFT_12260 [Anaeromyces robustus]|uniref:Uncharacterized protein n=1 Tax=Anaeromyces robustus TaxID=1754192 RepID=A0A1Y1X6E8_9FUNG|nr:hypothetical protein BCR32DRAFT_12260 [Anaeromyces robustus]|eukprot:ORX81373.1 hypothetical protein BCR32DRAFT_12260 [Anaeromyces robustus]